MGYLLGDLLTNLLLNHIGLYVVVNGSDSFDCNFDYGICNWKQDSDNDDFDWMLTSGSTPPHKYLTGPSSDHTTGVGKYAYIDSSKQDKNKAARLISTKKESGQYCLSLWYHMFGRQIGILKVIKTEENSETSLFNVSGNQSAKWIFKQMQINTSNYFQIVIEGRVIDDTRRWHNLECDNPIPDFGLANSENINIGSNVDITCQKGYFISGNPSIVCQANGTWTGNPECNPIECGEPTLNSDLIVDNVEGTTYNETITLACDLGFTLIGTSSITCQADGKWTAQPNCVIKNCTDPTPDSGYANSTNFSYGSVIEVSCFRGYKINGRFVVFCQLNSTWSDSPSCELIDCDVPVITKGMIVEFLNDTTFNKIAIVSCKHGYTFVGNSSLTCQADGSWTDLPKCIVDSKRFNSLYLETSSLLAVYVTLPVIAIAIVFILFLFIWRKILACFSKEKDGRQKAEINRAFQYPNETYNNHAIDGLSPTSKTSAGDLVQPGGDDYANNNDDMNEDHKHLYCNAANVGRNILKDTEHIYDHINKTTTQMLDNTYSHTCMYKTAEGNGFNSNYDSDDNYNVLSKTNPVGKIQYGSQDKPNEDTEYDHAKSGGSGAISHEQDEYSHLNETNVRRGNAEKELVNLKKGQYEYASETVTNAEKSRNKWKTDYELR